MREICECQTRYEYHILILTACMYGVCQCVANIIHDPVAFTHTVNYNKTNEQTWRTGAESPYPGPHIDSATHIDAHPRPDTV